MSLREAPVMRPCPPWCQMEPGHPYISWEPDTGRQLRDHCRQLSEHVDLTLVEYDNAPLDSEPVLLYVEIDRLGDVTAAQARQLAAELLNGADELDKVTDEGARWNGSLRFRS